MNPAMLALIAARMAGSPYHQAVMSEPSIICYYPLDDPAGTLIPADATGQTTPDLTAGVTFGAAGIGDGATAAAFDGGATGRGIRIPDSQLSASITAFTVEIIAQPVNMTVQRAVFGRDNYYLLRHPATASWTGIVGAPTWANTVATVAEPSPQSVHHLALTWDGTTAAMWRDGVQIATKAAASTSISVAGKPLHVGSRQTSDPTFLGTLAGFALHYNALSAARILAHAQAAGVAA